MRTFSWVLVLALCSQLAYATDQAEADLANMRWVSSGIHTYTMTIQFGCFCPPVQSTPIRVEVSRGQPLSATYLKPLRHKSGEETTTFDVGDPETRPKQWERERRRAMEQMTKSHIDAFPSSSDPVTDVVIVANALGGAASLPTRDTESRIRLVYFRAATAE